ERTDDGDDRRQVHVRLTPEGIAKERETRVIEDALYEAIDELPGAAELIAPLELLVSGHPAGEALKLRTTTDHAVRHE
ncbi:MAG: hypothetical protein B7X41_19075, partial [Microbacterium sp. 14-71-5]